MALGQLVQRWQLVGRKPEEEGGPGFWGSASNQVLGLKNTSDAALRGKAKAEKAQKKAAQKRAAHPHGPLERGVQMLEGGGERALMLCTSGLFPKLLRDSATSKQVKQHRTGGFDRLRNAVTLRTADCGTMNDATPSADDYI
jgi:hypothetical protein